MHFAVESAGFISVDPTNNDSSGDDSVVSERFYEALNTVLDNMWMIETLALVSALMLAMLAYAALVPVAKYNFSKLDNWWNLKSTDESSLMFSCRMPKVDVDANGYASIWRRILAELIDWFVCFLGALAIAFAAIIVVSDTELTDDIPSYLLFIPSILFFGLYHIIFWMSKWQATPGMRSLGIIITSKAGHRLGLGCATLRFFARWLSYSIIMVGFLVALFNKKNQTLHDKIAGTVVLHRRAKIHDAVAAAGNIK